MGEFYNPCSHCGKSFPALKVGGRKKARDGKGNLVWVKTFEVPKTCSSICQSKYDKKQELFYNLQYDPNDKVNKIQELDKEKNDKLLKAMQEISAMQPKEEADQTLSTEAMRAVGIKPTEEMIYRVQE